MTVSLTSTATFILVNPAQAQCVGFVRGLGKVVDPSKGRGVLSVRSGPGTKFRQITILLKGETATVFEQRGNWLAIVTTDNVSGWVHRRFMRVSC
ncbi:MAG: SH3 domain-containing protein [Hyphomicrobiales bacterium]